MNTVNDMGTPLFCTEDRQCMGNRNSLKKSLVFVGIIYLCLRCGHSFVRCKKRQ